LVVVVSSESSVEEGWEVGYGRCAAATEEAEKVAIAPARLLVIGDGGGGILFFISRDRERLISARNFSLGVSVSNQVKFVCKTSHNRFVCAQLNIFGWAHWSAVILHSHIRLIPPITPIDW
jgi:hypothetical protein